jgi:hypothetical protein
MSIAGTWYNELGSQMDIVLSGANITGAYWTAVGNASGRYDLVGQIDTTMPSPGGQAVGWTVVWNNASGTSNSVTTWSGQYQTEGGPDEIVAFWLLTTEEADADDWAATRVGKNVFTRSMPGAEQIKAARRYSASPHPRKT